MSFRCEGCNTAQPIGTAPNRTVIAYRTIDGGEWDPDREEIAKEKNLCSPCAEPYKEAAIQKEADKYAITVVELQNRNSASL